MIKSWGSAETESLFRRGRVQRFESFQRQAQRKLEMIDAAKELRDLSVPPGNRLEKLSGDRKGEYSVRVNDQWRVCFRWEKGDAHEVKIEDYH